MCLAASYVQVHERHLTTDMLLALLRAVLLQRPALRLVLMSATINVNAYADYFGGAPVIQVGACPQGNKPLFGLSVWSGRVRDSVGRQMRGYGLHGPRHQAQHSSTYQSGVSIPGRHSSTSCQTTMNPLRRSAVLIFLLESG